MVIGRSDWRRAEPVGRSAYQLNRVPSSPFRSMAKYSRILARLALYVSGWWLRSDAQKLTSGSYCVRTRPDFFGVDISLRWHKHSWGMSKIHKTSGWRILRIHTCSVWTRFCIHGSSGWKLFMIIKSYGYNVLRMSKSTDWKLIRRS